METLNKILNTVTILNSPYSKRERRIVTPLEKQPVFCCAMRSNERTKRHHSGWDKTCLPHRWSNLTHWEDRKSDMNGTFPKVLRIGTWTLHIGVEMDVQILMKKRIPLTCDSQMHIHINSEMNSYATPFSFCLTRVVTYSTIHASCNITWKMTMIMKIWCLMWHHMVIVNMEKHRSTWPRKVH